MYLLTQQEAAEATRLSQRTLERHRLTGTGPKFVRLGRRVLYRREDVEEWVAGNICRSTSEADSIASHRCKTEAANRGDLELPMFQEISAGISGRDQNTDHTYPHPPLPGKDPPFNSESYRAR